MSGIKLLTIASLLTAIFQGANCAVDAHTSPSVDGPQLDKHQESQSYTMIFPHDGVSKGDVAGDRSATIVASADSVLSTSPDSLKLLSGSCMIEPSKRGLTVDLSNSNIVSVPAHARVVFAKNQDKVFLFVKSGSTTVRTREKTIDLKEGSTVAIDENAINIAVCDATRNPIFDKKAQGAEPIRLLADAGTKFAMKNGELWLKNVTAFVEMPAGVRLVTPGGTMNSAHPYLVSCRMVDDSFCLENCSPVTSLEMVVRKERFKLPPFGCCSLNYCDRNHAELPDDGLLRKDVVAESDGKLTAMVCQYDPLSLIEANAELKRAVSKPITLHQQKTCEMLFKGIAVFQELCGDIDAFDEGPNLAIAARDVKGRIVSVDTAKLSAVSSFGKAQSP